MPDAGAFRSNLNAVYGAYCTLLGPTGNWDQVVGNGLDGAAPLPDASDGGEAGVEAAGDRPYWMCFARADCEESRVVATADGGTCIPNGVLPNTFDPGNAPRGNLYTNTPSDTTSTVRVEKLSDPSNGVTVAVDARASVDTNAGGIFTVSDLQVTQRAATTYLGQTVENTFARLDDVWHGTWNSSTNKFEFEPSSGTIQIRIDLSGVRQWRLLQNFVSSPAPFITKSGSNVVLDVAFADTANDLLIKVHLELKAPQDRPTATITSVSSTMPECTGPGGATVSLTASATSGVSGVGTHTTWLWAPSDEYQAVLHNASSITVNVPLESSTHPGHVVTFASSRDVWTATDTRLLRVIDTAAPSITSTVLTPVCGWGTSAIEPNQNVPAACAPVTGSFSDTCSTQFSVQVFYIRVYDWPSGTLLHTYTYGNGSDECIRPYPGKLDSYISWADYEIDYRVVDAWGNYSGNRRWRGYFYTGSSSGGCSSPAIPVTISDSNL
jgi:hypothetical protein